MYLAQGARKDCRTDTAVAQRCARLQVPDRRTERDALIAATAMVHGLTVVTRNVSDFKSIGVALLNPWIVQQAGEG
jgi:toxin FitB